MKIKINVLNKDDRIPEELLNAANSEELIARIFYNRGYRDPRIVKQMLNPELYIPTDVTEFPQMEAAVERVLKAIDSHESIAVYGDYDVDGVTSTVTLVECLKFFTDEVIYHVPDRFTEGYGMNENVIRGFRNKGIDLVITCDCGVSNINEVAVAKELGMDVIVTDHHNIPDQLPNADFILNPKLLHEGHKARNISGCAMAYFLCVALLEKKGYRGKAVQFMDLLALSLIADVVSLNGENRYLLQNALPELFNTKRTGLNALFKIIEKNGRLQTEEDVAFQIAPRINASGRMDTARLPVELLLCKDYGIANDMAQKINNYNEERKRVQQEIIEEATEDVRQNKMNRTVLVLYRDYWHHGIIGIAAGKVCETYGKPAILLSLKEDGTTVVGSARSIDEINIYELLKECAGKLLKFGGHSKAAGLSLRIEDVEAFSDKIEDKAQSLYYIDNSIEVCVDSQISFEDIDDEFYDKIKNAGPYGEGFEAPLFLTKNVSILSDRVTQKNHHIMVISDINDVRIQAVKWSAGEKSFQNTVCDIVYKIGRNTYKNANELQLTIEYIVETDGNIKKAFEGDIVDERSKSLEEIIEEYKSAAFFYEGLEKKCFYKGIMNRNTLKKAQTLVLLSVPQNSDLFKEIVCLCNPKRIIINFSISTDYSFKGFVREFFEVLRDYTKEGSARTNLEKLSIIMNAEEEIIRALLKYLQAAGKIEYNIEEDESTVCISRSNNQIKRNIHIIERNLNDALMEKTAYMQFVEKLDIENFKEYLK